MESSRLQGIGDHKQHSGHTRLTSTLGQRWIATRKQRGANNLHDMGIRSTDLGKCNRLCAVVSGFDDADLGK
ncbi:hypothetical protein U1Q18_025428 [Sarracenia purpurea var. burkii]